MKLSMACLECKLEVPIENRDTGLCATCNKKARDNQDLYPVVRQQFLEAMMRVEAKCPIYGTPISLDSDIHHKKGRVGYADQWAYDNGITLLIDPRFFLAASRRGHQWIEGNVEMAMSYGYTLTRQDTFNFNGKNNNSENGGSGLQSLPNDNEDRSSI